MRAELGSVQESDSDRGWLSRPALERVVTIHKAAWEEPRS